MAAMQFWGVAVSGKEATNVTVDEGSVIHLSQITLSEVKKDKEPVIVHAKVEDNKYVLGILSQNTPQLSFDLVFDSDFEISHNWKAGSIHFLGYKADGPEEEGFPFDSSEEEDEEVPVPKENGIAAAAPAPVAAAAKAKALPKPAKDNKPKPVETDDSDEDESDDEDDSGDDDDSDEDMSKSEESGDDDDSDEDDDDSDEDEKPAKSASGKKRPIADAKTPESKKKAKIVTPQKTDGKKGAAHTATPHPAKKGGKTPGGDKTPKSGGQSSCTPCKKTFNSGTALQSHNKAKHAAK